MNYDTIGGDFLEEKISFFTIKDLLALTSANPDKKFLFLGTDYTVGELHSWRGSYALPAISYVGGELRTGDSIYRSLTEEMGQMHYGYKGGEYYYRPEDEFYLAQYSHSSEYKVVGYTVTDTEVILNTKIDPY